MAELTLPESLLLLALDDEKGTAPSTFFLDLALAGGVITELLLGGWVAIEQEKRRVHLVVHDGSAPPTAPLLRDSLESIRIAKRPRSPKDWVMTLARGSKLRTQIAEPLCQRGILRAERTSFLLVFKRTVFPEVDPGPERQLIEALEHAIFTDEPIDDPRQLALITFADATNLLALNFDRKRLRSRKARLKALSVEDHGGSDANEAFRAAIVMRTAVKDAVDDVANSTTG
ncbi:MAG: GPP34 family phosphoprotein [Acidobacteriota bacterium]